MFSVEFRDRVCEHVLELASRDALPPELLDESALVRSLDRDELLRALRASVALLVKVDPERSAPLEERFAELTS